MLQALGARLAPRALLPAVAATASRVLGGSRGFAAEPQPVEGESPPGRLAGANAGTWAGQGQDGGRWQAGACTAAALLEVHHCLLALVGRRADSHSSTLTAGRAAHLAAQLSRASSEAR